jgi:hypothetical protein
MLTMLTIDGQGLPNANHGRTYVQVFVALLLVPDDRHCLCSCSCDWCHLAAQQVEKGLVEIAFPCPCTDEDALSVAILAQYFSYTSDIVQNLPSHGYEACVPESMCQEPGA